MTTFNDLSKQQLTEAAERFNIDVDNRWSDKTLAAKLLEQGVTLDQILGAQEVLGITENKESSDALTRFASPAPEDSRVVVKMDRENKTYPILGYKFTQDHPFVVMDEADALWITETVEGFRIVHPNEASKFYKK